MYLNSPPGLSSKLIAGVGFLDFEGFVVSSTGRCFGFRRSSDTPRETRLDAAVDGLDVLGAETERGG